MDIMHTDNIDDSKVYVPEGSSSITADAVLESTTLVLIDDIYILRSAMTLTIH